MIYKGKAHKYGADIDTDAIIPARYLNTSEKSELACHCMEDLDENFIKNVSHGDMIVAEENFGCGSSREHAPVAIMAAGVSCVIAKTFARIFYRNAINVGLPVFECPQAADYIKNGMEVSIDTDKGLIIVEGKEFGFEPFPPFIENIISSGGLMNLVKKELSDG